MCRLGETDHMPVDKTWGILNPSGTHTRHIVYIDFLNSFNSLSLVFYIHLLLLFLIVRRHPQIDIEEFNFLEKIFTKSKLEERTWAKLVNLNTVHWYCDGPEPTPTAIKYEERTRQRKSVDPFCLISLCLWPTYPFFFFRDGRRKKESSYQTSGRQKQRS